MPSYYARSTAIQLSTAPLATTSSTSASTAQSNETTSAIQSISIAFSKASLSQTLSEEPIVDAESGSHLLFLGNDKNIPFMLVHAGKQAAASPGIGQIWGPRLRETARPRRVIDAENALESVINQDAIARTAHTPILTSGIEKNLRRSSRNLPAAVGSSQSDESATAISMLNLEALSLNVLLSPQSFIPAAPFGALNKKRDVQDLQILVYMNGAFAASFFVPSRYAYMEFLTTKLSLRLTGNRLGRLVEKPWVLAPPQPQQSTQNDDSGLSRWLEISQLLLKEVDSIGKSKTGDLPISGEVLSHLASIPCPEAVKRMGKFGCMDVLLMTGKGGKNLAGGRYSTGPERMTDDQFQHHMSKNPDMPHTASSAAASSRLQGVDNDSDWKWKALLDYRQDLAPHPFRKRPHTPGPKGTDGQPPQTPTQTGNLVSHATDRIQESDLHRDVDMLNLSENAAASGRSSTHLKSEAVQGIFSGSNFASRLSGSASSDLTSRRRVPQTPVGEISPLSSLATDDLNALAPQSSAGQTEVTGSKSIAHILQSSPGSPSVPPSKSQLRPSSAGGLSSMQTRSGRQVLKLRPPKPPAEASSQTPQSAPAMVTTEKQKSLRKIPSANVLRSQDSRHDTPSQLPRSKTPATPLKLSTAATLATPSTPQDEHFSVPAASQDCVLGFAPAGVIRNVPAIKSGWFQETGVVYGCRFILS